MRPNNRWVGGIVIAFTLLILAAIYYTLRGGLTPPSTPTPTATPVPTSTVTSTPTPVDTATPEPTATPEMIDNGPEQIVVPTETAQPSATPITISRSNGPYAACETNTLAANSPTARDYIVQSGDSLSSIARDIYGSGAAKFYLAIYEETNEKAATDAAYGTIAQIDQIFVGQRLFIPDLGVVDQLKTEQIGRLALYDPADSAISDKLVIAGSSTVFPLTARMAECFVEAGYRGRIVLSSDGSLDGLNLFCAGGVDILDASVRFDSADFSADCRYENSELLRLPVGYDAVVIAVSRNNQYINPSEGTSFTVEMLQALLNGAETWNEIPGLQVDGAGETITRYYPGEGSGTLRFTSDLLFNDLDALRDSPNVSAICDDQPLNRENDIALADCVAGDPHGIAILPYAAYAARADQLSLLSINGRQPLPESTEIEEIERYLLFRDIFIYVPQELISGAEDVNGFVNYYLQHVNDLVTDVDLFPLSSVDLENGIEAYCDIPGALCNKNN